jgi:hypothetical protein
MISKESAANPDSHEPPNISFAHRSILIAKGVPVMIFVLISGFVYWLLMLWDHKQIARRTRHWWLKLRNAWQSYFRPRYVALLATQREHECEHCGACCEILWRCPILKVEADGQSRCAAHSKRPLACRTFPTDVQAIEIINKGRPAERACSYRFTAPL